jgi:hypothetical protein
MDIPSGHPRACCSPAPLKKEGKRKGKSMNIFGGEKKGGKSTSFW